MTTLPKNTITSYFSFAAAIQLRASYIKYSV